jgi:hypothetical protein
VEEEEQRDGESRGLDRGMIGRSRREYTLHPLHREGGESERARIYAVLCIVQARRGPRTGFLPFRG